MKHPWFWLNMLLIAGWLAATGTVQAETGKDFKVMVVMSYEQDNPWCQGIREGIESVLAPVSEITYFYMNTKFNFKGGAQKAKEADALYQQLKPHGLIVADDNAQTMFVVPYSGY